MAEDLKKQYGITSSVGFNRSLVDSAGPGRKGFGFRSEKKKKKEDLIDREAIDNYFSNSDPYTGFTKRKNKEIDQPKEPPALYQNAVGQAGQLHNPDIDLYDDDSDSDFDFEKAAVAGGITALQEVPKIAAAFQNKPRNDKEAGAQILQSTASGASIGTSILPGWGTAIGAGVGFFGGLIATSGKVKSEQGRLRDIADVETLDKFNEDEVDRKNAYFANATSKSIEAERGLFLQSQGYTT